MKRAPSPELCSRDLATTGDGILTGIQILDLVQRDGRSLSKLASDAMTRFPQVLRNVRVAGKAPAVLAALSDDIDRVERDLGERGRVLVRASGTEPVVRVMVEAESADAAEAAAAVLVDAVETAAGRSTPTPP
jgi:phosphoglucosamine mutase